MVAGDDEGETFLEVDAHFDEVCDADGAVAADGGDALGVPDAKAGDAVEHFEGGFCDVDREEVAVAEGPGELGVDVEIEVRVVLGGDFMDVESIEAHEPVGLVEAVLADEGRSFEGEAGGGVWDGAEGGVVDAVELKVSVEVAGAAEEVGVVRLVSADDHLGGLAGGELGLAAAFFGF